VNTWRNKKVGVLGAGVENVPLIPWLLEQGAMVTVADQKRADELASYQDLKKLPVSFRLGPGYLNQLTDFDVVFRTPFLPIGNKKLQAAKKQGVEISSQTKLFFERCPAPIIGVTGTKGKGTAASLIHAMLKKAGYDVYLGGNIGTPPISFLNRLTKKSWVVLELSSFQLEDLDKSPYIAVVMGISADHLDRHQTFLEYIEAKKQIVRYQRKGDFAILLADSFPAMEFAVETPAEKYFVSTRKEVERGAYTKGDTVYLRMKGKDTPVVSLADTHLIGRHNLENIGAAAVASTLSGANLAAIKKGAITFPGQPHQLELVGEDRGVKFYDDSHATTPVPTIAAIRSFAEPITLIVGGSSKKSDFTELGRVIAKESTVKHVILLGSVEAPKIRAAIEREMEKTQTTPDFYPVMSMDAAVAAAIKLAKKGEIVLLSPAAASFDLFQNYKDRGQQFAQAVMHHGH